MPGFWVLQRLYVSYKEGICEEFLDRWIHLCAGQIFHGISHYKHVSSFCMYEGSCSQMLLVFRYCEQFAGLSLIFLVKTSWMLICKLIQDNFGIL